MTRRIGKGTKVVGEIEEPHPVMLTNPELLERGHELAQVEKRMRELDREEQDVKAGLKLRRTKLEGESARLAAIVRDRKEERQVVVTMEADYATGTMNFIRADTGEVIRSRALGDHERQAPMFDEPTETRSEP